MGHDVHACQDYLARGIMYIWCLSWVLSFSYCGWSHNGNVPMWPVLTFETQWVSIGRDFSQVFLLFSDKEWVQWDFAKGRNEKLSPDFSDFFQWNFPPVNFHVVSFAPMKILAMSSVSPDASLNLKVPMGTPKQYLILPVIPCYRYNYFLENQVTFQSLRTSERQCDIQLK